MKEGILPISKGLLDNPAERQAKADYSAYLDKLQKYQSLEKQMKAGGGKHI